MIRLDEAKKRYDEIPIPEELTGRVQSAIACAKKERGNRGIPCGEELAENGPEGRLEQAEDRGPGKFKRRRSWLRYGLGIAAALAVMFTTALNTSTAFADMAEQLPVIGNVARILTFRTYEADQGDLGISVEIPSVEMISGDTEELTDELNREIYDLCSRYADEAVERAQDYKQAFLDTGGTEEEWMAHNIQIRVWYEIKSQTENFLSFVVRGSESWTSAHSEAKYYSLNLKEGRLVTLRNVLGDQYAQIAGESIQAQMKERSEREGITFWTPEEGGFSGVTDQTRFYMNEAGNPVIVFEKYEIAPGAYGDMEFEIERS